MPKSSHRPTSPRRATVTATATAKAPSARRTADADLAAPADACYADARYAEFSQKLRRWFRRNGRALPWRATRDPYRILVSELMLQQTQVSRVIEKYHEFLGRFPTLAHVADAQQRQVLHAWSGLGYYARARNLHKLAKTVHAGSGILPDSPAALRELPGIGAYTAGAVASFAFERRAALVDTNVARVLRRVFAPHANFKSGAGAKEIWSIAARVLPRTGRATWTHNQAVMELGALVCTARIAHCDACPVQNLCATRTLK
jgi:A/G-specific adenine glycosylase